MISLLVIAGPTASGKTAAAVELAEAAGAEILSCDSLAVYRELDIGTAKPTAEDRRRAPHHLLDVAAPDEDFTAARFVDLADRAIADCARRRVPVIVVGGSGLYLGALLHGLFPAPPPDPVLRAALNAEGATLGWPVLHARLATVDAEAAARIHPNDPIRIGRALEVHAQTGVAISAHQRAHERTARYLAHVYLIDPPGPMLDERIARRTEAMLDAGLVDETSRALARWGRGIKALGAVGYKEALAHVDGTIPRVELPSAIRTATRRYGKRQRTWFKKEPDAISVADATALPRDEMLSALVSARDAG